MLHRSGAGSCESFSGVGSPCNSVWGSASAGGTSITWGTDLGWYLTISSLVLLIGALIAWTSTPRSAVMAPASTGVDEGFTAGYNASGLTQANIDRLIELRKMVDSGHLSADEFQQVKARLLGTAAPSPLPRPSPSQVLAEELQRLKELHDTGVLTDEEYAELRKRTVARL